MSSFIQDLPLTPFLVIVGVFTGMTALLAFAASHSRKIAAAIKATPTSNVNFATDGYVAFDGTAQAVDGTTLTAPLTGAACLWYHAKIEEWKRKTTKSGASWHTVRIRTSSEPFILRDSSGECVVFPEAAEAICTDRSVWFGPTPIPGDKNPPRKGPFESPEGTVKVYGASDKKYRYTEERIYAGNPLYALGQFSAGAADDDQDDDEPDPVTTPDDGAGPAWDLPSRLADFRRRALAKTKRRLRQPMGKPYVLSTTAQAKLLEVHSKGSRGALLVAVVPLAIAIALLWLRFR
jgi:E3 Ubiquitin ligase